MRLWTKTEDITVIKEILFTSQSRRSAVLLKYNHSGVHRLYIKGGAEIVIDCCEYYWDNKGESVIMDDVKRDYFKTQIVGRMGRGSYSPVALAHVDFDGKNNALPDGNLSDVITGEWAYCQRNLTLEAVVGIKDPLHPEVIKNLLNIVKRLELRYG